LVDLAPKKLRYALKNIGDWDIDEGSLTGDRISGGGRVADLCISQSTAGNLSIYYLLFRAKIQEMHAMFYVDELMGRVQKMNFGVSA
jgi:hypothetical protein